MKALIIDNVHLIKDSTGKYYSGSVYSYAFLQRYLKVFDEIRFVGKTRYCAEVDPSGCARVDGPGVEVYELPWFQGLKQMGKIVPSLMHYFRNAPKGCDCIIYRVGQLESFAVYMLGEGKLPYVVEVVNDPESFPGGLVRDFSVRMVRKMTARAQGASYVTERFLQEKYPSRRRLGDESGFESFYSSIDLDERTVRSEPRGFDRSGPLRVVHVANAINDDTKGLSTLLKAAAKTVEGGLDVRLTCVGDGAALDDYKRMAEELGIKDRVQFVGRLTGQKAIFEVLDRNDMLVLPTRMEGLPRTVIESMARGLPCLSTPVAGIPELLETKYLFQPDDYEGFAEEILRLASCPEELRGMGARNIEKAREYTSDKLGRRRTAFYEQLRDCAVKR